jgi:FKBP-type peptidyl-prolyl cis-trans isomerase (trigger factor)
MNHKKMTALVSLILAVLMLCACGKTPAATVPTTESAVEETTVPPTLPTFEEVEKAIDAQMENLEAQLTRQGLNTEMYCNFMNTTKEALREDARHDAEAEVRKDAAIREIVKLENLEVTQEEIGEAVALICRQNKITVEELKPYYDEVFEQAVIKSVLTGKVMRLIGDAADITVV